MFLRLDPRENNIPVEGDDLTFNQRKTYVSINSSGLERCSDSILGLADLTKFLADNQLSVAGGNLDFWDAGNKRQEWITCENKPLNKVVAVTAGNETKISADGNCYTITINNCQVLNATERFILQSVLDARKNNKALAKAE